MEWKMKIGLLFSVLAIIVSLTDSQHSALQKPHRKRFMLTRTGSLDAKYRPFRARGYRMGNSALRAREEGAFDFSDQNNAILSNKQNRKPTKATKAPTTTVDPNKINIEARIPESAGDTLTTEEKVIMGQTAILHCNFDTSAQIGQYSQAQIWWTKLPQRSGDRPIILAAGTQIRLPDDRLKIITFPDNSYSILVIQNTIDEDVGEYKCSLPTVSGTLTTFTKLMLREPPKTNIVTSQQNITVEPGEDVTLTCEPEDEKLDVWWTAKNASGDNLQLSRGLDRIYGRSLNLARVHHRSAGVYTCNVANNYGNPSKRNFNLQIKEKPWPITAYRDGFNVDTFLSKFNKEPEYGDDVQLRCDSGGIPKPVVGWFKDGQRLHNGDKYQITNSEPSFKENSVSGRLLLSNFQPENEGRYWCVMTNEVEERQREFTVRGYFEAIHTPESDDEDFESGLTRQEQQLLEQIHDGSGDGYGLLI